VIGVSFEVIWTYPDGTSRQIEVGPHEGADHTALYMGKTRRVGTRFESDSVVFWTPDDYTKQAETIFINDLETLMIRKLNL
jgi:hypothetical protein